MARQKKPAGRGTKTPKPLQPIADGDIHNEYIHLKALAKLDWRLPAIGQQLLNLTLTSLRFLTEECRPVALKSLVPGKAYFGYVKTNTPKLVSRPVNSAMMIRDPALVEAGWTAWMEGRSAKLKYLPQVIYTMAMAYCVACDLFDRNNKKGPATYFEHLVGHIFAKELGISPNKRASIPGLGKHVALTMDFIFNMGEGKAGLHLPVKTSTRERVVQAWAHQRILDKAYGEGKFKGMLVVFADTKLSLKKREVIEICVPDQWLAYQRLLARMDRIYYFDMPNRYVQLAAEHTDMPIKHFAEFFSEKKNVLARW